MIKADHQQYNDEEGKGKDISKDEDMTLQLEEETELASNCKTSID